METEVTTTTRLDPAAMAFEGMRAEMITVRLAIQQLVAVPMTLDIPDYTDTLAAIRAENQSLAAHYKKLRDAPALAITPDQLAKQIAAAGAEARQAEQAALVKATSDNAALARELSRYLEQVRTANEQWKWILWTGGLCLVAGLVLMGSIWAIQIKSDPGASTPVEQPQSKVARKR